MPQCLFIPNPIHHDRNGRVRPLSPEAWQFWQLQGGVVGSILRHETPLPLSAIVEACLELAEEQADCAPFPEENEQYVAWCLLKLVEHDLAAIVLPTTRLTPQPIYSIELPMARLTDR
jgi:hypothetical protein